jgi:virginiamycin B lyase
MPEAPRRSSFRKGEGHGDAGSFWVADLAVVAIDRVTSPDVVTIYTNSQISPYGIAVGSDGALWFTNLINNSLGRITS